MPRVKRGTVRRAKRQKLAKLTKGSFLNKSKLYRAMKEAADRAGRFAYRDRRRRTVDPRPADADPGTAEPHHRATLAQRV